ncbi:MAG: hypothetical protein ABSG16_08265 [Candidatus Acidiferrum sp.]|jgi:hypothetical protein
MHRARHLLAPANTLRYALPGLAALLLLVALDPLRAQDDSSKKSPDLNAGITLSGQATAKEVGLPIYPGAKPHKDSSEDSSGANLGLWGGSFGFKLVVLKLESTDTQEKIAAFYKKALAKYGPVLDCSNPPGNGKGDKSGEQSNKLTCGDDKADGGGQVFKSGTKEKQHLVAIKPASGGSKIDLLYLEARGADHDAL